MTKLSKNYRAALEKVGEETRAPLEAMALVKEVSFAKFDETVEADFRLGIDTRQADQQLRGTVSLRTARARPSAWPCSPRAKPLVPPKRPVPTSWARRADAADPGRRVPTSIAAVATPIRMGKVGRLGKILGPRGLMPNPKLGTVTNDVAKAINELKGGRVEYRADRYGIAHVILGKVSFTAEQLAENYGAVYDEILRMKPAAAKGKYVKSITVSSTMSPGVKVDPSVNRNYTEPAAE